MYRRLLSGGTVQKPYRYESIKHIAEAAAITDSARVSLPESEESLILDKDGSKRNIGDVEGLATKATPTAAPKTQFLAVLTASDTNSASIALVKVVQQNIRGTNHMYQGQPGTSGRDQRLHSPNPSLLRKI